MVRKTFFSINSSPPGAAYMHQWHWLTLIQVMAITWTNADFSSFGHLGRDYGEIRIKIPNCSFMKIYLKMSSAKWRSCCPGRDELIALVEGTFRHWPSHIGNNADLRCFYCYQLEKSLNKELSCRRFDAMRHIWRHSNNSVLCAHIEVWPKLWFFRMAF